MKSLVALSCNIEQREYQTAGAYRHKVEKVTSDARCVIKRCNL